MNSVIDRPALPDFAAIKQRQQATWACGDYAAGAVESGRFAGLTEEDFLRLDQGSGERVISGGDVIES